MLVLFLFLIPGGLVQAQENMLALGEPQKVTNGFEFTEGPYWPPCWISFV
jgi:hypothetical protein